MSTASRSSPRKSFILLCIAFALTAWSGIAAATYPPEDQPAGPDAPAQRPSPPTINGLIFTNTHSYAFGADPTAVVIKVEVFDNYLGDFTKYHWVYTVTNNSYEPSPGSSNGFSGFELALPQAVPDIANITAPDGIPPWLINCCSGLPVEWDLRNADGAAVNGGTLPGQTEVYTFTTSPRLITQSTGWFHTWQNNGQTFIVNYPSGDGPEVPDVLNDPGQELCCYKDSTGADICQVLPAGQCQAIGGLIVVDCTQCPPMTPTQKKTWGELKTIFNKDRRNIYR